MHWDGAPPALRRPAFLAIVASNTLAVMLARKSTGRVDGFVVEGPTAGGHNAPPRGELQTDARGEPIYGPRDAVDLARLRALGLPFWLAGGAGSPEGLAHARAVGAAGVQVGTLFAFCDESGVAEPLRRSLLRHARTGELDVRTDPRASPTGYPFKVVSWPEDPAAGVERERVCDLGYLRVAYARPDGKIGYRCPGEPIDQYLAKGGRIEDTVGRRCLCNTLTATIGLGQVRGGGAVEPPLVTSGDDLQSIGAFLGDRTRYTAADVIAYLRPAGPRPVSHNREVTPALDGAAVGVAVADALEVGSDRRVAVVGAAAGDGGLDREAQLDVGGGELVAGAEPAARELALEETVVGRELGAQVGRLDLARDGPRHRADQERRLAADLVDQELDETAASSASPRRSAGRTGSGRGPRWRRPSAPGASRGRRIS